MDPIKKGRGKVAMARLAVSLDSTSLRLKLMILPQVILKAVMLRRKKTTMIDGKAIINLPGREVILVSVPFKDV